MEKTINIVHSSCFNFIGLDFVTVDIGYQLDRIRDHRQASVHACEGLSRLDWLRWAIHLQEASTIFWTRVLGPTWKESELNTSIRHFLLSNCRHDVTESCLWAASGSCGHDCPVMLDYSFELWVKALSLPEVVFDGVFLSQR